MAWTVAWRGQGNDVNSGAFVFTIPQSMFSPMAKKIKSSNHGLYILFRGKKFLIKCYAVTSGSCAIVFETLQLVKRAGWVHFNPHI